MILQKHTPDRENLVAIERALDVDGFVVLAEAFPHGELEELTSALTVMAAAHAEPGETASDTLIRLNKEDPQLLYRIYRYSHRTIAVNRTRQTCARYASAFLRGPGIYIDIDSAVIFNLPYDERLTWTWHQESAYHPQISKSLGFWFPVVQPATVENGTMSVLRGSHTLGCLPHTKYQPRPDAATSLVPDDIDRIRLEFPEVHCVADVGDLVIFHKDLIHRSNLNRSTTARFTGLVRLALIDRVPDTVERIP